MSNEWERLLQLFTHRHTRELVSRQVAAVQQLCRSRQGGLPLEELHHVRELLGLLIQKVSEPDRDIANAALFVPALVNVIRLHGTPFVKSAAFAKLYHSFSLVDSFSLLRRAMETCVEREVKVAVAETVSAFVLQHDDVKRGGNPAEDGMNFKITLDADLLSVLVETLQGTVHAVESMRVHSNQRNGTAKSRPEMMVLNEPSTTPPMELKDDLNDGELKTPNNGDHLAAETVTGREDAVSVAWSERGSLSRASPRPSVDHTSANNNNNNNNNNSTNAGGGASAVSRLPERADTIVAEAKSNDVLLLDGGQEDQPLAEDYVDVALAEACLRACRDLSANWSCALELTRCGVISSLHRFLTLGFRHALVDIVVEMLWNLLDCEYAEASEEALKACSQEQFIVALGELLAQLLLNGYSSQDKQLRNHVLAMLTLLSQGSESSRVFFGRWGIVGLLLRYCTHVEIAGIERHQRLQNTQKEEMRTAPVNAGPAHSPSTTRLLASSRNARSRASHRRPESVEQNLPEVAVSTAFTQSCDELDMELKILCWTALLPLVSDRLCMAQLVEGRLLECLALYIDTERPLPCVQRWTPTQLRELQTVSLRCMWTLTPRMRETASKIDLHHKLLQFASTLFGFSAEAGVSSAAPKRSPREYKRQTHSDSASEQPSEHGSHSYADASGYDDGEQGRGYGDGQRGHGRRKQQQQQQDQERERARVREQSGLGQSAQGRALPGSNYPAPMAPTRDTATVTSSRSPRQRIQQSRFVIGSSTTPDAYAAASHRDKTVEFNVTNLSYTQSEAANGGLHGTLRTAGLTVPANDPHGTVEERSKLQLDALKCAWALHAGVISQHVNAQDRVHVRSQVGPTTVVSMNGSGVSTGTQLSVGAGFNTGWSMAHITGKSSMESTDAAQDVEQMHHHHHMSHSPLYHNVDQKHIFFLAQLGCDSKRLLSVRTQALQVLNVMCQFVRAHQRTARRVGVIPLLVDALTSYEPAGGTLDQQLRHSSTQFMSAAVDAVWAVVVGNHKNELRFLVANGVDALLDLLCVAPLFARKHILGCLADLARNPKAHEQMLSWRGRVHLLQSVTMSSASHTVAALLAQVQHRGPGDTAAAVAASLTRIETPSVKPLREYAGEMLIGQEAETSGQGSKSLVHLLTELWTSVDMALQSQLETGSKTYQTQTQGQGQTQTQDDYELKEKLLAEMEDSDADSDDVRMGFVPRRDVHSTISRSSSRDEEAPALGDPAANAAIPGQMHDAIANQIAGQSEVAAALLDPSVIGTKSALFALVDRLGIETLLNSGSAGCYPALEAPSTREKGVLRLIAAYRALQLHNTLSIVSSRLQEEETLSAAGMAPEDVRRLHQALEEHATELQKHTTMASDDLSKALRQNDNDATGLLHELVDHALRGHVVTSAALSLEATGGVGYAGPVDTEVPTYADPLLVPSPRGHRNIGNLPGTRSNNAMRVLLQDRAQATADKAKMLQSSLNKDETLKRMLGSSV